MASSHALDLATRKFWRLVGRPIDLVGPDAWLRAPISPSSTVGDRWLRDEADHHGGRVDANVPDAGLLPGIDVLDRPGFATADLRPEIVDFYENTAAWSMEVWTAWSPVAWPAGELISRLFGQRVEQLALPMRPLDVARGMDSRIDVIRDGAGHQASAAWIRTLRSTGGVVFSGCYATRTLPGADGPSVHVAFPLEAGNVQVFLRPSLGAEGSLLLQSPQGRFGDDGAYVMVHDRGRDFAARIPLHETFHVFLDEHGVLRTDHELRLAGMRVARLHYKLERSV